jgi:hypothetical protein
MIYTKNQIGHQGKKKKKTNKLESYQRREEWKPKAKSQKPKAKTPAPFFMNRQLNSIIPGNDGALCSPLKNEPIRLLFFGTSCVMLLKLDPGCLIHTHAYM